MQKQEIKKLLLKAMNGILPCRWITDNFWMRIFMVRPAGPERGTVRKRHPPKRAIFMKKLR